MQFGSRLIFILASFALSSCASSSRRPLSAPITTPPPAHDTASLGGNIADLDQALKKASSQIERIKILINSIPED